MGGASVKTTMNGWRTFLILFFGSIESFAVLGLVFASPLWAGQLVQTIENVKPSIDGLTFSIVWTSWPAQSGEANTNPKTAKLSILPKKRIRKVRQPFIVVLTLAPPINTIFRFYLLENPIWTTCNLP